uniref:Uncharacterized protein n=1 Tax=Rheinheimera sp. BAL341 TaxID=1708203 RepID=A0A486XND0_9GAMM
MMSAWRRLQNLTKILKFYSVVVKRIGFLLLLTNLSRSKH